MDIVEEFRRRTLLLTAIVAALLVGWFALQPHRRPPAIGALNGVYRNACCLTVTLNDGVISSGGKSTHYTIANGKYGADMIAPAGITVHDNRVIFEGNSTIVPFYYRLNSVDEAGVMHLVSDDGHIVLFAKN